MSDTKALPNPENPDPPQEPLAAAETGSPLRTLLPWLAVLGFLILLGAIVYVWRYPSAGNTEQLLAQAQRLDEQHARLAQLEQAAPDLAPLATRVEALENRAPPDLAPIQSRLDALENRAPPDLAAIQSRLDALENRSPPDLAAIQSRLDALETRPAPDLAPIEQRLAQLENRPVPDLGPVQARLAALEQRPAIDPQVTTRLDALAARLDSLAARAQSESDSLNRRIDTAADSLGKRIDADIARLDKLDAASGRVSAVADRAARLARLQAAEAALSAGQSVGEVPGAPPALARFAKARPPTEAELRLSFPAAERAARAASRPDTEGKPFLDRVWNRAQELVTVRQGDNVLVGDTASGVLARARTALDAGDLAGTVAALDSLDPAARQAMAGWLEQAQALLDARAALADMAARV